MAIQIIQIQLYFAQEFITASYHNVDMLAHDVQRH